MYFLDFEHCVIGYGHDLSYLKIHGSFNKSQLQQLIEEYASLTNQPAKTIGEETHRGGRITRINDVVWAAMQWTQTGEERYQQLTHERQQLALRQNRLPK